MATEGIIVRARIKNAQDPGSQSYAHISLVIALMYMTAMYVVTD